MAALHSPTGASPVPPLSVTVDLPRASVRVAGELDRESAHHLLDAMAVLSTRGSRRWRLDTSGVTFCDAGGLRALTSAHTMAAEHNRDLRLEGTGRPVHRLVELVGRDRVFPADRAATPTRRASARLIRCGTTGTP